MHEPQWSGVRRMTHFDHYEVVMFPSKRIKNCLQTGDSSKTTKRRDQQRSKEKKQKGFNRKKTPEVGTLATGVKEEVNSNAGGEREKKSEVTPCVLCNSSHDFDTCKQFMTRSLSDRREFIRANALCLGYLKWWHMITNC